MNYKKIEELLRKSKFKLTEEESRLILNNIINSLPAEDIERYNQKPLFKFFLAGALSFCFLLIITSFYLYFSNLKISGRAERVVLEELNLKREIYVRNKLLREGDIISTPSNKTYRINIRNLAELKIYENSKIKCVSFEETNIIFEIYSGKAFFSCQKKEKSYFTVRTPSLEIKVKGTRFEVEVTPSLETVRVSDGIVSVRILKENRTIDVKETEMFTYSLKSKETPKTVHLEKEEQNSSAEVNIIYQESQEKQKVKKSESVNQKKEKELIGLNEKSFVPFEDKVVTYDKNTVYVFATEGKLIPKTKIDLGNIEIKNVVIDKKILYITSENGSIYAYTLDGKKLWENSSTGIPDYTFKPVIYSNLIYLSTLDKGIQVFDLKGTLIDTITPEVRGTVYNSIIVQEKSLIYFTRDGYVGNFDLSSKKNVWKLHFNETTFFPHASNEEMLFVYLRNENRLVAIKTDSGKVLWSYYFGNSLQAISIYIYEDFVVFPCLDQIFIFKKLTGEKEKELKFDFTVKQLITEKNKIYILTDDTRVILFSIPSLIKIYENKFGKNIIKFSHLDKNIYLIGDDFLLEVPR
ncbi:MAG: FecR domain-containing protein [Brevinematia bacterium]